jgi:hypothetical protein
VFRAPTSLTREGEWVDRASASLPELYVYTGDELAGALRAHGDIAGAQRVFGATRAIASATGLDDLARAVARDSARAPALDSAAVEGTERTPRPLYP